MEGLFALYYLLFYCLEEPQKPYGIRWEEQETEELLRFVRQAMEEVRRRGIPVGPPLQQVRITRACRIYIGKKELKVRPMAKTILLLFLKHPEGILLKNIMDYRAELTRLYRRVSRSSEPEEIERRVVRILDLFNNDLNVSIARVNNAVSRLVDEAGSYRIEGSSGQAKRIKLNREWVIWEEEIVKKNIQS